MTYVKVSLQLFTTTTATRAAQRVADGVLFSSGLWSSLWALRVRHQVVHDILADAMLQGAQSSLVTRLGGAVGHCDLPPRCHRCHLSTVTVLIGHGPASWGTEAARRTAREGTDCGFVKAFRVRAAKKFMTQRRGALRVRHQVVHDVLAGAGCRREECSTLIY